MGAARVSLGLGLAATTAAALGAVVYGIPGVLPELRRRSATLSARMFGAHAKPLMRPRAALGESCGGGGGQVEGPRARSG